MEGRQRKRKLDGRLTFRGGIQANDAADHSHEGEEENQDPDNAEYVKHQVGQSGTAGLHIGIHGRQVGGKGGADVFTHHQGDTLIDGDGSRRAKHHGNGHQGGRRLHHGRKDGAYEQEQQDGDVIGLEAGKEVYHRLVTGQVHLRSRLLEHTQRKEQERQAEEEVSNVAVLSRLDKDDGYQEGRPYQIGNVEGEAGRHDPCAHGGTDVGTHNNGNSLC